MMRSTLRAVLLALAIAVLATGAAAAQGFELPGIDADSAVFQRRLSAAYPAGGTDAGRAQSEVRADAALKGNDPNAAAAALEQRAGQGQMTYGLWLRLAQAEAGRVPPDAARAVNAAYLAFRNTYEPREQATALALAAQVLMAGGRPAQASLLLGSAVQLAPDQPQYAQALSAANRAAGLQVQRVTATEDADPPRACIAFNVAPSRRNDFHPEDWVRLQPAVPDAAVTREGDEICVSGLPLAATTTAVLRAGLPGVDGLSLAKDTPVALTLGNRAPRLLFNSALFILPHGQAPRVTLTSTNVSSVKVSIALFTERTMLPWARDNELGKTIEAYSVDPDRVRVVWSGTAAVTGFQKNKLVRTALPLPADAMRIPGLYAVLVQPADGQIEFDARAVQPILLTDLAPTVWRGTDGLTVQVRNYSDAAVHPGVVMRLMAQNNDVLAEATTDAQGMVRFGAPLLHGEGVMAAAAIQGLTGGDAPDFVSLNLDAAAFDLSDRGVSGAKQPGQLDGYLWTDRGIYRPGETVQLMALLRDNGGQPVQRPAHLRVLRPNGVVLVDSVVQPGGGGSLHLPVHISDGGTVGIWTAQLLSDPKQPPIAEMSFKVDAFVPDRMAVTAGPMPEQVPAGIVVPVPVTARYFYGPPAAHLQGSANVQLAFAPKPPAALAGYDVGLVDEMFAPDATQVDMPATDDAGKTTLPLRLAALPDTTHPVQVTVDVEVDDPSGRASRATAVAAVRPATDLIGIKRLFGEAVDADSEAGFDVAAVDPDGKRVAVPVTLRLVRERPEWHLVVSGGNAPSYQTTWRSEPLETHELTVPADGVLHFARRLPFGRYRLEVLQKSGLAAASVRFRSGWVSSESPDVPDRADVSADKQSYPPGATARVHVAAPFGGPATLVVMTDHVHSIRMLDVPAGGADVEVPVDAAWGPGAYVAVHVFRGETDKQRPDRAIGLVWLGIDPAARRLPVAFEAPELVRPRLTAHATVRTAPGAWVSVAAVDEGILRLTAFSAPDPGPHFLGRRALGVDIRDDWGRLILPADGDVSPLRQGGDESAGRRPNIPQQIVSLFQAPVQADAEGRVDVPLPFPDFNGQVRLMAVAWDGNKMGAAAQDMLVRDQLLAEPLLPRFLAPGDQARLGVMVQNLDLPGGAVSVHVSADGPLAIVGNPDITATLARDAQSISALQLQATGAGTGHVRLEVTGPDGFRATHEAAIDVHSARGANSLVVAGELAPAATATLAPDVGGFIGGTWQASATFGGPVRYDVGALLRVLDRYPLFCLEQASSKGMPLAVLPDDGAAGPERLNRLQRMVNTVMDRERYDGGFGLWAANDPAEPWLSEYAIEFLLRAKRGGATVGEAGLNDALKFLSDAVNSGDSKPEAIAGQAYRLYDLALAGQPLAGANRVLFEKLHDLPTPLAKAQLGAALALSNDRPRAEAAFTAALDAPARRYWAFDFGDAMRDQAAVATLLKESGLLPDRLRTLLGQLSGADLKPDAIDTQDSAWLATAGAVLGREGVVTRVSIDSRAVTPAPVVTVALTKAAMVVNTGDRPVWQAVSVSGVLATAPSAARAQMHVSRRFFALDGSPLDLDHLRQNTVFVLLLEGAAEDGQAHRTQIIEGLPAGWEIAGHLVGGDVAGMPWLGKLTEAEAQPAADDRFMAVSVLTEDEPGFRIAVRLRAVTPGSFELPGAEVSDMYRPGVFARQNVGRVSVLPAQ